MSEKDTIICSGCSKEITAGNIISFENKYWHPDCFKCMKCNKLIDLSDNNILLCEDKPICSDCGYVCHVCGEPITGEAITTDDMILHFSCFKCQCCGKYIDNLTYILVNNEIHCTNCNYKIDEDVQNDFGISSPVKNTDPTSELSNLPQNNLSVDDNENSSSNRNSLNTDEPNNSSSGKDKRKKCKAKHCSMLQDKNALHRISLADKMLEKKSNNNSNSNIGSSVEKNSPLKEVEVEEQEMDENPSQHNKHYIENKKFTDEEYYILKVKNEKLISENNYLKKEQESLKTKYEEKIEEEMKKNEAYEKTINTLLEEKKNLKDNISEINQNFKKYEEDYKLNTLKYENENNLFQIKYEDLKAMFEKEKEERIIAESTIVRLQEEIHIRYLDELKYTYIYDIEAKYQSEFEILENQKQ